MNHINELPSYVFFSLFLAVKIVVPRFEITRKIPTKFEKWKKNKNDKLSTLEKDLHREENLDRSLGEISAMLHPSKEARAVLPLLWM